MANKLCKIVLCDQCEQDIGEVWYGVVQCEQRLLYAGVWKTKDN